jgi:hypothetical protein
MNTTKMASSIILLVLLLAGCSKKIAMEKMPATQIIFGSGGGFTAQAKEYCLLENGKIVEKAKDGQEFDVLTTIDRDKATQCFSVSKTFKLDEMQFNEPGNMYYFVTIKSKSKAENKIVWGDKSKPVSSEVSTLYKMLMSFLPKKEDLK